MLSSYVYIFFSPAPTTDDIIAMLNLIFVNLLHLLIFLIHIYIFSPKPAAIFHSIALIQHYLSSFWGWGEHLGCLQIFLLLVMPLQTFLCISPYTCFKRFSRRLKSFISKSQGICIFSTTAGQYFNPKEKSTIAQRGGSFVMLCLKSSRVAATSASVAAKCVSSSKSCA